MNVCDTKILNPKDLRYNELVYRMTNRRVGYTSGYIPDAEWFTPESQSREWYMLQSGLNLDVTSTDYYVFLALSILHAHPDILNEYSNKLLTFDLDSIQYIKSNFTGGKFTSVGKDVGRMLSYRDVMPIPQTYTISKKNDKNILVSTDVGRKFACEYNQFTRGDNSVLVVDWHKNLPFKGPIILDGLLNAASRVDINYTPFGINPDQWVKYVDSKMVVSNLLDKLGMYGSYHSSQSSSEKLALLIIALVLLNTSSIN